MKTLMTIVMALSLSQAFGQASAPAASPTMPGGTNTNNGNQPTFGSGVRNTGTTTGSIRDTNTTTTTDSIGTTQSSTTREVIPNSPGTMNQPNTNSNTNATGVNCIDRSGRTYSSSDTGYNACVNAMRMR